MKARFSEPGPARNLQRTPIVKVIVKKSWAPVGQLILLALVCCGCGCGCGCGSTEEHSPGVANPQSPMNSNCALDGADCRTNAYCCSNNCLSGSCSPYRPQ